MENGSQGTAANSSGSALATDVLYTRPQATAPRPQPLTPISPTPTPEPPTPAPPKPPRRHLPTKLLITVGAVILAIILIVGVVFAIEAFRPAETEKQNTSQDFENVEIPLDQLVGQQGISVLGNRSLVINGQLRTNDSLVVAPSGAPTTPTAGQIYYDQNNNQLGYYNGSQFIYVGQGVNSVNGTSGELTTGTGLSLVGNALSNSGVLSFQGQTGAVTLTAGSGITIDGTTISSSASSDPTVGNEITDVVSGGGLLRVGSGTTLDPYKAALQSCANGEVLKSTGGTWICGSDNGTASTAGNGLQLVGNEFSVNSPTCAGTDKLQWNGTAFVCSPDAGGVLYSAGTGLSLVGSTFNNTGTLTVTASGALTSSGGQNPDIAFANGTISGQFWQWNGVAWILATLPGETDAVIGNEVTNVTGANSGLTRSGAGSVGDPYTLAINAGNGLALNSGSVVISSPTCVGTDKLQWNGTAFACSADVDTDTNTTYSAGTGLSLVGTTFNNTGALSVAASGALTSTGGQNPTIAFANGTVNGQFWQWNGSAWVLATLAGEGDAVVGNEVTNVTGANSGLARSGTGTSGDPYTLAVNAGNGLQLSGGAVTILSATCAGTDKLQWNGTAFICSTDVDTDTNTTYSTISNGGLRLNGTNFGLSICANGELLQAQAVSGEWACVSPASVGTAYTAGDGLSLTGTDFDIDSPTCAGTDKLQWNGTAFVCSSDIDTNTDAQTLSWVDGTRTLSISGGNSVVIGDDDTTYSALANGGMRLVGTEFALSVCANGEVLKAQAVSGEWACATDNDTNTTYSAGTGMSLVGTTFNNTGILSVTGSGPITATAGQNPTVAFANGTVNGQFWQWNGSAWALAALPAEGDAVIGNEVTNVTGINSGLSRSGTGTSGSPYTLGLMSCASSELLQSTGVGTWACASPSGVGTSYNVIANGGIRLVGSNFGLKVCAAGELLQAQATSGEWDCVASTGVGTSYTEGTGIDITGTTISNTGVISVAGSGPITSSGGQNPSIDFVDGTTSGEFWQWNGTAWVLATLPSEGDAIVGNEVTGVTGVNSGLTRSGAGTGGDPYTLAVNTGNGLQLSGGTVLINSPTCAGTDKLQWNGTAFICSTDVDTNTTYGTIANGGLRLNGTNFGLSICATGELLQAQVTSGEWACVAPNTVGTAYTGGDGLSLTGTDFDVDSPTCAGTDKLQWNGTAFICSTDVNTDAQTLSWVDGTRTLTISGGNSVVIGDDDTTYTAMANGGLRLVGTEFALGVCTNGQVLKAQVTSGEWACAADDNTTYSAGTGVSLVGTTFNNTGILSVSGSGPVTATAGQNPTIAFANGTTNGEFWQWNGSAWVLATLPAESDAVIGNEVTNVTGINSGLTRSGTGTGGDPYTLAVNAGNGLQLGSGAVLINSPTCSGTTKLQWNGTAFICSTDVDTTYSVIANGGLRLSSTSFGLSICATGELLQAQAVSGEWACVAPNTVGVAYTGGDGLTLTGTDFDIDSPTCAGTTKLQWNGTAFICSTDVDTTYSAGTGISLVGTTFSNSGILTLSGSSNFSITGGQTANIAFANGSVNGQVWQWNGSAWVLATMSGGVDTLQASYTASTGGTTPEIKLDSTRGALDIQDANTTIGANLLNVRASNGSGLGAALFSIGNTGVATFQNSTDSSAAFKVLNAAGGSIVNTDTVANKVSFGVYADFDSMTKLSNPATLPPQRVLGLSWSPDSQYAVAGFATTSPFMHIYKRSGDTFTKLADPATLPPSHARGSSWSPDGTYMSIAHVSSPYVTIYKRSGDTFTKLTNPSSLPAGEGYATAWSPDGQYMTVAHTTTPYITIYKRDGDTFTKLSNPLNLPAGDAYSTAWSPDGQYMTVAHDTSPFITIYKRSGDTFTKLANPASLPTGGGGTLSMGVSWSPNSTYMAVAHNTTPFITVYKRSGDTFTKLANPSTLPDSNGTGISWSPTGNYLAVAHQAGSSCGDVYSLSNDVLTELSSPPSSPLGDCRSTAWSPDGRFLLFGNDNSPFINIYKASDGGPRVDTDIFGRLTVAGTTAITQGNLTVEGNISSTSLISAQTASISGSISAGGPVTLKNAADSANAFQVQNAAGNTLFNVHTTLGSVQVALAASIGNGAVCSSLGSGSTPTAGVSYTLGDCSATPAADYMEMYSVDNAVQTGDIVAPGSTYVTTKDGERVAKLTKSTSAYQSSVIGIASNPDKAGDFNSIGHNINDADRPFPVALNGRVQVKMSESSPAIEPGDYITASGEAGKGTKATQKGQVVGKALESWTPGTGQATVMVYASLEWRDPTEADSGDLFIEDKLGLGVQDQTLSDDGVMNDTLTPAASFIRINQDSGAHGGNPSLAISKYQAKDGDLLVIVNADTTREFTITDSSDVNVPGSNITIGPDDTVSLIYSGDRWIATSHSDN